MATHLRNWSGVLLVAAAVSLIGSSSVLAQTPDDPVLGPGWLGVGLVPVELTRALELGYKRPLIAADRVFPNSPAAAAGLERGDLILSLDEIELTTPQQLVGLIQARTPGTTVDLLLLRGGVPLRQPVLLGARREVQDLVAEYFLDRPAPALSAVSIRDGSEVDLAALRGKVVLVEFWATWCVPCIASIPHYNELAATYPDLAIIAVSQEDADTIGAFMATHQMDYTVGYFPESSEREFFVTAYPTLFIIDQAGTIRSLHVGSQGIAPIRSEIERLLGVGE